MSLTRREAMSDINLGRGICLTFTNEDRVGKKTTFQCIIRKRGSVCEMVFDCQVMRCTLPRKHGVVKPITLTTKQVMAYIKRNYPRHDASVCVQSDPFKRAA